MTTSQVWKNKFPAVEFQLLEPNNPNGIDGTYIMSSHTSHNLPLTKLHSKVRLKAGCNVKAHTDWLKSAANTIGLEDIKIKHEFELINGYSVELSDDGLLVVASSPDVKSITQDRRGTLD
ncbi:hypothetical protein FRC09_002665 [Ceratobasidium sp. 395]|nr:hypothetical protein FRC09_002665 [Ceratobasidium sp. 395]